MNVLKQETVPLWAVEDVARARQVVRAWTVDMKFSLVDQTKIVTAASELGRNTVIYGGGGELVIESINDGLRTGLRLTFADRGPGIPDITMALKDGYTTGGGLGLGLGGAKRLMSDFAVESKLGEGTRVAVIRWK